MGSEPQIYFYSQRFAATEHVNTIPLMENHPYAQKMHQEMIDELEASSPKFMVFVNVWSSWLAKP